MTDEIPGWFDWQALYRDAVDRAPESGAHFVECGTFFGKSADFLAREILSSGKTIRFDTWDSYFGVPPERWMPGWVSWPTQTFEGVQDTLAGLPVKVCRGDAIAAADEYEDGTLDLVFLDDDHSTDHVTRECGVWWPKLRIGGVLAGHDYDWECVRTGVHQWAEPLGLHVMPYTARSWSITKMHGQAVAAAPVTDARKPLLEVVTRHLHSPRRADLLQRQQDSLAALGDNWIQTLLVDPHRAGVPASHVRLRTVEPFGQFVWVLDDDDVCLLPNLLSLIDPSCDLHIFRMLDEEFDEPIPLDAQWETREIEQSWISAANMLVRADLWMRTRHAWGEHYAGDFPFCAAAAYAAKNPRWIKETICGIDVKSRGSV